MAAQAHAEKKSWASPLSLTLDEIWSRRGTPVVVLAPSQGDSPYNPRMALGGGLVAN